ncbi:hypothetical protein [Halobacillus sp. BBL2006]|uniref:hypothetical protein n=1 Tax=Halobacillus sp. BBL2006 TaxID=1543706 RepID=UPI000541AF05|nr:hypothetical protein [Halobacillus sp. BBL2006]KHE73140.1 hypothetical protein LD39_00670 [Halobacillus sp. BBL2006]
MKKLLLMNLLIFTAILGACSNSEANSQDKTENNTEDVAADDQEKINKDLKEKAIEIDFPVSEEVQVEDEVMISGEVTVGPGEEQLGNDFSVETQGGIFEIMNLQLDTEVNEGDQVTVYGTYRGEDADTGLPSINATIVEQK